MATRRENTHKRKLRIIASARALIASGGVESLTIRRVAPRARVSVATIYNLFGSKEAVLWAIVEDAVTTFLASLSELSVEPASLRKTADSFAASILDNAKVMRPAVLAAVHFSGGRDQRSVMLYGQAIEVISRLLQKAQAAGQVQPGIGLAPIAYHIVQGVASTVESWAFGMLTDEEFQTSTAHTLLLGLLGAVTPKYRRDLEQQLQELGPGMEAMLRRLGASESSFARGRS